MTFRVGQVVWLRVWVDGLQPDGLLTVHDQRDDSEDAQMLLVDARSCRPFRRTRRTRRCVRASASISRCPRPCR